MQEEYLAVMFLFVETFSSPELGSGRGGIPWQTLLVIKGFFAGEGE